MVGILGGIAIAGGGAYMAARMRTSCNALLHCVAAHIHSGVHKSLDCIVPAFKKMYTAMHYTCRSYVRLATGL
jgi:hypothetical protein